MTYSTAVTRDIAAPSEKVWALVTDLPRMGEWSPENAGRQIVHVHRLIVQKHILVAVDRHHHPLLGNLFYRPRLRHIHFNP